MPFWPTVPIQWYSASLDGVCTLALEAERDLFWIFQAPSSPAGLSLDGLGNPKVDPQMERGQEAKGPRRIIRPEKEKKTSAVVSSYVT